MRADVFTSVVAAARQAIPKKQREIELDESTTLSTLQIDSLGVMALLVSLEGEVGIRIDDQLLRRLTKKLETLGDIVDLVLSARQPT